MEGHNDFRYDIAYWMVASRLALEDTMYDRGTCPRFGEQVSEWGYWGIFELGGWTRARKYKWLSLEHNRKLARIQFLGIARLTW